MRVRLVRHLHRYVFLWILLAGTPFLVGGGCPGNEPLTPKTATITFTSPTSQVTEADEGPRRT